MPRPKRLSPSVVGLAALGLAVGLATATVVAVPPPQEPFPASTGIPPMPSAPPPPAVLLMADGRVVQGEILETSDGYLVRTPIGRMPFKRRDVVSTFGSIRELYEYKRVRTAERDPDELMKLVHWCIENAHHDATLRDAALAHVETILQLSPGLKQAEAMQFQLQTARHTAPPIDDGVVRTSVDEVEPAMLSSRRLQQIREAYRQSPMSLGSPMIPGMPQAQTVMRFKEFKEYIHRGIQQKCAKCHGEDSNSRFTLIQAKVARDMQNEHLVRANFDSVIQLVNPRDPIQSELLTRSISPHPPDNRPVLTGPNDPVYRMLHYWVQGLESATAQVPGMLGAPSAGVGGGPGISPPISDPLAQQAAGGGFASDRAAPPALSPTPMPYPAPGAPGTPYADPGPGAVNLPIQSPHADYLPDGRVATRQVNLAGQMLPGTSPVNAPNLPPASEFTTSPLLGGPNPAQIPVRGMGAPGDPATPAAAPAPGTPVGNPGQPTIHVPGLGDIPVVDTRALPAKPPGAEGEATPAKPPSINKDALQRFMTGQGAPR